MTQVHYAGEDGVYLGSIDAIGVAVRPAEPDGAVVVPAPPPTMDHRWNGSAWAAPASATVAARLALPAATFKAALAAALGQPFATIDAYLAGQIDASALTAADQDLAKGLLAHAATFHRIDPDIGDDLMVGLAVVLGFGAPDGGWTAEPLSERQAAAAGALDTMFIAASEG